MVAYYPYFRGKQYELICIRESAELIAAHKLTPIIEVVREDVGSLSRCLAALEKNSAGALILARPAFGPLKDGLSNEILACIKSAMENNPLIRWVVRVGDLSLDPLPAANLGSVVVLHDSPADATRVLAAIDQHKIDVDMHFFVDGSDAGSLYRTRFNSLSRVILKDGFKRKKNADYLDPDVEHFSDSHLTHQSDGFQGFGDFLTVGSYFAEGGGQAYAVAIHITFKNGEANDSLFVHHFVSDSNSTPVDPAEKFREAVLKLAKAVNSHGNKISRTSAINEFLDLHARGHYPGLGYVKKLSMQHHLELMAGL